MKGIYPKESSSPIVSARELQSWGFSRVAVYKMLGRSDLPVVRIGNRKFMARARFLEWIENGGDSGSLNVAG